MRRLIAVGLCLFFSCVCALHAVQGTWNWAVEVTASTSSSPPSITLSWPEDTTQVWDGYTPTYTVSRKAAGAASWSLLGQVPSGLTTYTDTSVAVGVAYEYEIFRSFEHNVSNHEGYGYIQAGINVPLVEDRGKVILIVDNTFSTSLAPELARLERDLVGDGWTVLRRDVSRTAEVASVKQIIQTDYNADPTRVKAVFLFGHVPVPYSGMLNPDGHSDHLGAWPADVYYGDMDGTWTDADSFTSSNTNPAIAARLTNLPGDDKFDQTIIPGDVGLQVGRVDMSDMPGNLAWNGPASFPSEESLLRQYLDKNHKFRHRDPALDPQRRAVMGDYFGIRDGEAFAASGFRAFAPLVGTDAGKLKNLNVDYNDQKGKWVPELSSHDYLLAYGCGAGGYSAVSGLGTKNGTSYTADTLEMVEEDVRGVFVMLFGSYFGDWNTRDNVLRAILATPSYGLASMWSGRPHWFLHPMGLGETIGYSTRLTQNNDGAYKNHVNDNDHEIHIALMGDPTLRLLPVRPVSGLTASSSNGTVTLSWTASNDSIVEYRIYRAASEAGPFTWIKTVLGTSTSTSEPNQPSGAVYMVRAVKLEATPSGSYYNASQGVFATASSGGSSGTPTVTVTAADSTATIGTTDYAEITFNRTGSTTDPLTIRYSFGGTATTWNDYRRLDNTIPDNITIPAGQSSVTMTIKATGVNNVANPETASFTIINNSNTYTIGSPNSATININNDSGGSSQSTVTVTATDSIATINTTDYAVLTFTRTGSTIDPLTIRYSFGGTATTWNDYRRLDNTIPDNITIPAGQSSVIMTIKATEANDVANPETASFTIINNSNTYTIGSPNSATININN